MIVMCAYMTPELLAIPGNIPSTCVSCGASIIISGVGMRLLREGEGRKHAVCASCVAENAPADAPALPPGHARMIFESLGLPDELLRLAADASIKEMAEVMRDYHRRTVLN